MTIRLDALPELADRWAALEQLAGDEGIELGVADYGGYRTAADTAEIVAFKNADYAAYTAAARAAGRVPVPITGPWDNGNARPIAPYGRSYHNYGAARDFVIVSFPPWLSVDEAVARVQELGERAGFRSGRTFGDDDHLELPLTLEQAAAAWAEYSSSSSSSAGMTALLVGLALSVGVFTVVKYAPGLKEWR
jgi:hypothetical protein